MGFGIPLRTSAALGVGGIPSLRCAPLSGLTPALNLIFTGNETLDGRITFTRSTTATRTNSGGLIESVAIDAPRFDYDPATLQPKGLLIEEQRTNLLTYSEQFDNAAWAKSNASVTANAIVAPDGNFTADKLVESVGFANHEVGQSFTPSALATYTLSCYFKAAELSTAYVRFSAGLNGANASAEFNLISGSLVSTQGAIAGYSIKALIGGWYRISVSATASALPSATFAYVGRSLGSTGDGTSGIYIWGAQLEAGSFPTSYIPTTSAQVTRAADVAVMTGTNFSSWYNQSEGTFYAETDFSLKANTGSNRRFTANDGTSTNFISIASSLTTTATRFLMTTSGVAQVGSNASTVNPALNKDAMSYATNNVLCCTNAGTVVADTAATIPTVNQLVIGLDLTTGSSFALNGHLRRLAFFSRAFVIPELQALTA